jgi:hypothetical protein
VKTLDGFESIDALLRGADQRGKKRADYLVRNRHVVIEQKVLHSNPIGRPQKFIDKLARERGIRIYGRVSTNQVFARQPNPVDLQRKMVLDLARIIDNDVANADILFNRNFSHDVVLPSTSAVFLLCGRTR